jgi:hypothetical protein
MDIYQKFDHIDIVVRNTCAPQPLCCYLPAEIILHIFGFLSMMDRWCWVSCCKTNLMEAMGKIGSIYCECVWLSWWFGTRGLVRTENADERIVETAIEYEVCEGLEYYFDAFYASTSKKPDRTWVNYNAQVRCLGKFAFAKNDPWYSECLFRQMNRGFYLSNLSMRLTIILIDNFECDQSAKQFYERLLPRITGSVYPWKHYCDREMLYMLGHLYDPPIGERTDKCNHVHSMSVYRCIVRKKYAFAHHILANVRLGTYAQIVPLIAYLCIQNWNMDALEWLVIHVSMSVPAKQRDSILRVMHYSIVETLKRFTFAWDEEDGPTTAKESIGHLLRIVHMSERNSQRLHVALCMRPRMSAEVLELVEERCSITPMMVSLAMARRSNNHEVSQYLISKKYRLRNRRKVRKTHIRAKIHNTLGT